jgi:starch-binding outer membrane protein SusE/F
MKNIGTYLLAALGLMMVLVVACTEEMSEVKLPSQLSTSKIQNIASDSAVVIGYVVAEGSGLSERGVCYSTSENPTTAGDKVVYQDGGSTSTFNVTLKDLAYATKYYARAYAVNSSGTIYGEELAFTTLPVVPTVTTGEFESTSGTSASGGGSVTNAGGGDVTARGVCYSTSENPTIADDVTVDGEGVGDFVSTLTNLSSLTTYYVRAYATNSAGTGYGEQVSFTTPKSIITLWVAGGFQGWNPGGATDSLMNTEANPIVQGYVYFPSAGTFKIVSQKNWDGPNYGAGDAGFLSTTGGDLSVPSAGYYLFKINMDDLSYTQTKTDWGVVGDATAGGWGGPDQNMTYSTHFKKWFATIPLTAAEMKFRANDAWDLNYGDDGANGSLEEGGSNIAVSAAGTYSAIVTLSKPGDYSYMLTQWSIIGSAGAGWGTDTDMTPNANNTWTLTTDLVVGEFKFRANHDWGTNLGGPSDNLSWGGANVSVGTPGNYTITLDLINGSYTLQLN